MANQFRVQGGVIQRFTVMPGDVAPSWQPVAQDAGDIPDIEQFILNHQLAINALQTAVTTLQTQVATLRSLVPGS